MAGKLAGDEIRRRLPDVRGYVFAGKPAQFSCDRTTVQLCSPSRNQYLRGWIVVIFKRHACELFELDNQELSGYWCDVSQIAAALNRIYQPVKINYGVFGNLCPHIHCHLIMQYPESDPHKPINMHEQAVLLNSADYDAMIEQLRKVLRGTDGDYPHL